MYSRSDADQAQPSVGWQREGMRVRAVPLDPVICSQRGSKRCRDGVRRLPPPAGSSKTQQFDCLLYLNVLHLARDPVEVLSLFRDALSAESVVIIQAPNMLCVPGIWRRIRNALRYRDLGNYDLTGAHLSFIGKVRGWCRNSGLRVDRTVGMLHRRAEFLRGLSAGFAELSMSPSFVSVVRTIEAPGDSRH